MHSSVLANPGGISGQNRKKLGEAAGHRLSATGLAAAFAASLAILVLSVAGALTTPPAVQVEAGNSVTKPAPTSSVDDPGSFAFESNVGGQVQDSWGEFEFFH